ncbi:hypothetical protein QJS10_CPA08g01411 [Acorus calamus]|uniref:Geranylgeranyl transferase type II subunit beta n=1 Tax=Acorus calamus TaxID=4465 RepID=A0AAV9EAY1_ACOCL|nr:hypothetical protein QJS10_CPA08g01411 [Acorus calamus]
MKLEEEKHVQYILSVEKRSNDLESLVMDHLKLSGAYWGLTTLHLLGRLSSVDQDRIIDWVLKCQHESGGFAGNVGHDPHILHTLSAVQVLALFDRMDVLDVDKLCSYVAGLQNEDGSFSGDMWGEIDTRYVIILYSFVRFDILKAFGSVYRKLMFFFQVFIVVQYVVLHYYIAWTKSISKRL